MVVISGKSEAWLGGSAPPALAWASRLRFEPNLAENCHVEHESKIVETGVRIRDL